MDFENFTLSEEEKAKAMNDFVSRVRNFPTESERKDKLFNCLNSILEALGSYLNDDITFKRESSGDKEYLIYKSVYGAAKQDITGDSVKSFLEDSLTLLFSNCRELQGSLKAITEKTEEK